MPVFETSAVPIEPDPQILMAGIEPARISPAEFESAAFTNFATSAFYCTSRESNSAGMLRITMSKQRIVFMDTISARHCIHPIASYAFPISPSCNDPIGDRTRVYAVRGRRLPARLWDRGVTTGNRTPMSRSTICRSAVELWTQ